MHTSYSALNTFLTCPLKYKFQQIDKIKTPPSPRQILGSLIHATLKFAHGTTPSGFPTSEEVIDYFSRNFQEKNFPLEESENYFTDGLEIIQSYLSVLGEEERKKTIVMEYRFSIPLGEHTIGGSIDRIDRTKEGFEIIDYKTDRKVPPQDKIDKDLQLSIYLKAFIEKWPSLFAKISKTEKIKLSLFYLRHGLKMSTTRTPADLEQIEKNLLDITNKLEETTKANSFEPRMNPLCDWCDYQKLCPSWSHKFKPLSEEGLEEKVQKASLRFIELKIEKGKLEKELVELGKTLSCYLEEQKLGQFFTENGNILRMLRETYAYDKKSVVELFKKWGIDPLAIMKIDPSAFKKVALKLTPEQRRNLENYKKLEKRNYCLTVKLGRPSKNNKS